MAYSIYDQTNYTQFNPIGFDQLIQPLQYAQEQHNATENQLYQLGFESDQIGALLNENVDPISYQLYNKYSNALKEQADELATNGLTPNTSRRLLQLRNQYASQIMPIQQAINSRQESYKRYADAISKDPSLITDINPATVSLDQYLTDKNAYNYKQISGEDIRKSISETVKPLAQQLYSSPEWGLTKEGQYFQEIIQRGFSPMDINNALNDNGNPLLKSIVASAMSSSGISQWNLENNPAALDRFLNYVNQGLYSSIGKTEVNDQRNLEYLNPLQRGQLARLPYQINLDRLRAAKLSGEFKPTGDTQVPVLTYPEIFVDNDKLKRIDRILEDTSKIEYDENGEIVGNIPYQFSQGSDVARGYIGSSGAAQKAAEYFPEGLSPAELSGEYNNIVDKYKDNTELGANPKERIRNGLLAERAMAAQNLPRYTPSLTTDAAINEMIVSGIRTGGLDVRTLDSKYHEGKPLSQKDKEKFLMRVSKNPNEMDFYMSPKTNKLVISDAEFGTLTVPFEVFGSNVAQHIKQNYNAGIKRLAMNDFQGADRFFRNMAANIAVSANSRLPVQGRTNAKLWNGINSGSTYNTGSSDIENDED